MPNEPVISVIIPCFNHGQFIHEAIASVESCNRSDCELIIVNDGSTDTGTQKVIRELESAGYHVVNQENQGLAAARNNGIRAARGTYILPLDADNRIRPNYLAKGIAILDTDTEAAVVYGRPNYFGAPATIPYREVTEFNMLKMLKGNYIDACAIFRKSVWEQCGGYDSKLPAQGLEDWDFWLSVSSRGFRFVFLNEVVFDYRIRPDSMLHTLVKTEKCEEVLRHLTSKHPILALHKQIEDQERKLTELQAFVKRVQQNPLFKSYHWLKHFRRA